MQAITNEESFRYYNYTYSNEKHQIESKTGGMKDLTKYMEKRSIKAKAYPDYLAFFLYLLGATTSILFHPLMYLSVSQL